MNAPDGCSIPGCDRPLRARGLCAWHYEKRRLGLKGPRQEIRRYRDHASLTKVAGLRLQKGTAKIIVQAARKSGTNAYSVLVKLVEECAADWAKRKSRRT